MKRKLGDAACNQSDDSFVIEFDDIWIRVTQDNEITLECYFWYNNAEFIEAR